MSMSQEKTATMTTKTTATLRAATIDDVPRIVEMALHFIADSRYQHLVTASAAQLALLVTEIMGQGIVIVADVQKHHSIEGAGSFVEQQVGGMIAIATLVHPFTGELYGDEIAWWVEPDYRANGTVGHKLLCAGEDWARQKGLSVLKMVAPSGSDVGTHYVRRGFELVETVYQKKLTE